MNPTPGQRIRDTKPMPQDQEHQEEAARSNYVPGSIPRNCVSCYRGYLARKPRTITRRNGGMTVCRMGVNMASSKSTQEEVEELTEWVDITAFREHADRLARMTVGEMIVIMGPVSVHFYTSKGRTRIGRTIVAESLIGVGASKTSTGIGKRPEAIDPDKLDEIIDSDVPAEALGEPSES